MGLSFVIGTRPEITKSASIIKALYKHKNIEVNLLLTGQQTGISLNSLKTYGIKNFHWLVDDKGESNFDLEWKIKASRSLRELWSKKRPRGVLVLGDTNSALLGAEVAKDFGIPILYLESGIRHKSDIVFEPEEKNRRLLSKLADYHFSPDEKAFQNLISEGINKEKIFISGDFSNLSLYESVKLIKDTKLNRREINELCQSNSIFGQEDNQIDKYILCTFHRQESLTYWEQLAIWLGKLSLKIKDLKILIVTRPDSRWENFYSSLKNQKNIFLLNALDPVTFLLFLINAESVISDSAGVQQESVILGKKIIVTRRQVELYNSYKNLIFVEPPFSTTFTKFDHLISNQTHKKVGLNTKKLETQLNHLKLEILKIYHKL